MESEPFGYQAVMPIKYRKVINLGPIRLNMGNRGLSSWSLHLGKWTWNSRTRKHHVDLPGPFSWRSGGSRT
jgi:hypothetical protein